MARPDYGFSAAGEDDLDGPVTFERLIRDARKREMRRGTMPYASREQLDVGMQVEGYEARSAEWGDVTVVFESTGPADPASLFKGLPDDRCQAEHYGYVLEGELVVRYIDREETIPAGSAYYLPPGHLPLVRTAAQTVEFTKTLELQATTAVIMRNMEAGVMPATPA
jgi:hypothetical protein